MEMQIEDLRFEIKELENRMHEIEDLDDSDLTKEIQEEYYRLDDEISDKRMEIRNLEERIEYLKDTHQWYDDLDIGVDR